MLLMNLQIKLLNLLVMYVSVIQLSINAVNVIVIPNNCEEFANLLQGYFNLGHPVGGVQIFFWSFDQYRRLSQK